MTKIKIAYDAIEECIAQGMTDLPEIYTKIELETGIPRPTIRQAKAKLLEDVTHTIKCLERKQ